MKKVLVLIERALDGEEAVGREAMRLAVGLTLADNEVTAVLRGAAARALARPDGELLEHLEAMRLVKVRVVVAGASLPGEVDAEWADDKAIDAMMDESDIVIPFLENDERNQ